MRKPSVGGQELEVLRFIAEHTPISTGEVARQFGEPNNLARGTIIKMMERLHKKGYLTRRQEAGIYAYSPSVPKQQLLQNLMQEFVEKTLRDRSHPSSPISPTAGRFRIRNWRNSGGWWKNCAWRGAKNSDERILDSNCQPVGRTLGWRRLAGLLAGQRGDSARLGSVPGVAADVAACALLALASGLCKTACRPVLDNSDRYSPAAPGPNVGGALGSRPGACPASHIAPAANTPLCVLMLLWLLGGMGVAVGFVREWRSARLRGGTAPLDIAAHAALVADFESLCRRFGVRRPIALLVTGMSEQPHVFGVIRPAIVLPADLLAESERPALLAVLAHEIAHVQRQDLLWNGLPALAHTLFFFYPLVWLANREWQIAQEIACDELAVLHTRTEVAEYGRMLVRMVTPHRHAPASGIATLGIVETPQTLKRRLIAMRLFHPISRRKLVFAGVACAALGIFGIVPWKVVAQGARTNRILFVSNRLDPQRFSIFAMDSDGSHVTRLTHGPLPESEAVTSSDNKTVLRPVEPHRNAMELDPVWSPDGKKIVFTLAVPEKPGQEGNVKMNLYVMNADGSDGKQLTHYTYGREASSPAWSPDGKYIAFTLQSRNPDAPGGINSIVCVTDLKGFWPVGPPPSPPATT